MDDDGDDDDVHNASRLCRNGCRWRASYQIGRRTGDLAKVITLTAHLQSYSRRSTLDPVLFSTI